MSDKDDASPSDPKESKDSDNDGVGDDSDAFPNDPIKQIDNDKDGFDAKEDCDDNKI